MKRLLKPTGHLLTTAVFTSTALDATLALDAHSLAAVHPEPMGDRQATEAPDIPALAETVIPPEGSASREYAQTQIPSLPAVTPPPPPPLPLAPAPTQMEPIPAIAPPAQSDPLPDFTPDAVQGAIEIPVQMLFEAEPSPPVPPATAIGNSPSPAEVVQDAVQEPVQATEQEVVQDAGQETVQAAPPAAGQNAVTAVAEVSDDIGSTQDWLDQQLAAMVARDRPLREAQFRENLIESARQAIVVHDFDRARQIAQNPALSAEEREALLATIEQAVGGRFRPLAPLDPELNLVGVQSPTAEPPSELARSIARRADRNDWLLSRLSSLRVEDRCIPEGPALMQPQTTSPAVGRGQTSSATAADATAAAPPSSWRSQPEASNCAASSPAIGGRTLTTVAGYEWLSQTAHRQPSASGLRMIVPLAAPATITSNFGWRTHPIYGDRRFHFGVDFGAPMGTPVIASVPGRVKTSAYLNGYGLTVVLENPELGQRTLYAHLSKMAVQPGDWVEQGTVIGYVGSTGNSTGPHLHFEVHQSTPEGWVAVDPMQAATELLMRWNVADRQP